MNKLVLLFTVALVGCVAANNLPDVFASSCKGDSSFICCFFCKAFMDVVNAEILTASNEATAKALTEAACAVVFKTNQDMMNNCIGWVEQYWPIIINDLHNQTGPLKACQDMKACN